MEQFLGLNQEEGRWRMQKPCSNCTAVFYRYTTIAEANANEWRLKDCGLEFVRFEAQSVVFDVPEEILWDSNVISRSFTGSRKMRNFTEDTITSPLLNEQPIKVPFDAGGLEEFLFALAFLTNHRELEPFASSTLCTIMKIADYFECPNVLRIVIAQINDRLAGQSPSEICEAFHILSDITQFQRHQIEKDGLWYFKL